jgi:hypothetical protein
MQQVRCPMIKVLGFWFLVLEYSGPMSKPQSVGRQPQDRMTSIISIHLEFPVAAVGSLTKGHLSRESRSREMDSFFVSLC